MRRRPSDLEYQLHELLPARSVEGPHGLETCRSPHSLGPGVELRHNRADTLRPELLARELDDQWHQSGSYPLPEQVRTQTGAHIHDAVLVLLPEDARFCTETHETDQVVAVVDRTVVRMQEDVASRAVVQVKRRLIAPGRDSIRLAGHQRPIQNAQAVRMCRHSCRAMIIRWIWFVPSKICITLASRMYRSTGKSRV